MILNSFPKTETAFLLVLGVSNSPKETRELCKFKVDLPRRGISPAAHWEEPGTSRRWAGRWGGSRAQRWVSREAGRWTGRWTGRWAIRWAGRWGKRRAGSSRGTGQSLEHAGPRWPTALAWLPASSSSSLQCFPQVVHPEPTKYLSSSFTPGGRARALPEKMSPSSRSHSRPCLSGAAQAPTLPQPSSSHPCSPQAPSGSPGMSCLLPTRPWSSVQSCFNPALPMPSNPGHILWVTHWDDDSMQHPDDRIVLNHS